MLCSSSFTACRLRHVPLVSRFFSEACRDPNLWPDVRVWQANFSTEVLWRSFLRWLDVRASGLQTFACAASWVHWQSISCSCSIQRYYLQGSL